MRKIRTEGKKWGGMQDGSKKTASWQRPLVALTRCNIYGAGGGNRTPMMLPSLDFESSASTSFTTPANWDGRFLCKSGLPVKNKSKIDHFCFLTGHTVYGREGCFGSNQPLQARHLQMPFPTHNTTSRTTMITEKDLADFQTYMQSGQIEEDFEYSGEDRRFEMLDLLEKFMNVAEIADETATKLIFKNSQLGEIFGEKSQNDR